MAIRQHTRKDGKPPLLYSLTRRALEVAQTREPPAISQKREWRPTESGRALRLAHDLHALAWAIELHRLLGDVATDHWRTPRYATGRYPVPQTGSARDRHLITNNEIRVPDGQAIIDFELKTFSEVKPDLSLELRIDSLKVTFDLLVELDLTSRPVLQPRQAPRLRRVPMRLEPRPPALPNPRDPTRCGVRVPEPPRRTGARPRGRPGAHRPDRRHGHPGRALILAGP